MLNKFVSCPRCQKKTIYSSDNIYRPFCSERCKIIDLGDWASGNYRIPTSEKLQSVDPENEEALGTPEDNE